MEDIIFNALYSSWYDDTYVTVIDEQNLNFNLGFSVDLTKEFVEVPICYLNKFLKYILDNPNSNICKHFLIADSVLFGYKTVNACIKHLFDTRITRNLDLIKIKQDTNYIYGNRNLILDSNKNLLYAITICLKKENNVYKPIGLKCRINNIVYEQENDLNKFIKGKMFNSIIELNKKQDTLHHIISNNEFTKVFSNDSVVCKFDIIINNMEDIIYRPFVPSINDSSETINNFLKENIDEVINTF